MSDPLNVLINALRSVWPQADATSLSQVAAHLMRGQSATLGTSTASLTFGQGNTFQDATISVGDIAGGNITKIALHLPQPPDPFPAAQALFESIPHDQLPEPTRLLPPSSRISFSRHPQFVGRQQTLRRIAVALTASSTDGMTPVLVTGLGGSGKTSLAVEFAYRYGPYFQGGIFWISCSDPSTISTEIATCAVSMGLAVPGLALDDQVAVVRRAWQEPVPRLLIFDTCEDPQVLTTWMPTLGGCRVLVTARRGLWPIGEQIPLEVFPREESTTLIRELAPHVSLYEADRIAAALGDLPLAVYLAGKYLARVRTQLTPTHYRELVEASNLLDHASLTGRALRHGEDLPTQHIQHIARMFSLSLEQLDASDPIDTLARHLLTCLACLAPDAMVPLALLWALLPTACDPLDGMEALERLLALGVVEHTTAESVRTHRLVHQHLAIVLPTLSVVGLVLRVLSQQAATINMHWDPAQMAPLLPHLRWRRAQASAPDRDTIALLHVLSDHEVYAGAYREALPLAQEALLWSEALCGPDDTLTATSLHNLADLYTRLGTYDLAYQYADRAIDLREARLGADHLDTAQSISTMGSLLHALGHVEEARSFFTRALDIREAALGPDDPTTALSLNNLGGILEAQGDLSAAEHAYRRALDISTMRLPTLHPIRAVYLHNLANVLMAQGDPDGASPLMEQALTITEIALGPFHPSTAIRLTTLGRIEAGTGAYDRAHAHFERAYTILEATLGAGHPLTITSLQNRAVVLYDSGEGAAAIALIERTLATIEHQNTVPEGLRERLQANLAIMRPPNVPEDSSPA